MRILFLTSTLPRFEGDMQANFVGEQAEAWLLARREHEITILAPGDIEAAPDESAGRLSIRRFSYFRPKRLQKLAYPAILPNIKRNPTLAIQIPFYLHALYRAAAKAHENAQFDATYAHWVMPQGLIAYALKRRFGIPYVLQTHSSDLAIFRKAGRLGRILAEHILIDADRFFCVNSNQLELALSYLPESAHAAFVAKSKVLPMGVASLSKAECYPNPWDIGTIGRLSRKKGLNYLVEAAEALARDGLYPSIAIAGDGEDAESIQAQVDRSHVRFTGFLTGGEKEIFLNSCKRFAFPAKASGSDVEGMPVALLEALTRGQPVLASSDTNIELLPEWPQIRDDVIFVKDPSDISSLARGLEDLFNRPPNSAFKSKSILARYLWPNLIEEYLHPIEETLSRIGKSSPTS